MSLSIIKTGAIAAAVLALSVSGAFAATYGSINYDTKIKYLPKSASQTIGWADEGDYVKVIDYTNKNGGWFRIDPPGPNNAGWVKKSAVDLDNYNGNGPGNPGVQFCFYGPLGGYICVNN